MYYSTEIRFNLLIYLRVMFKILNCFGLTGISFFEEEQVFDWSEMKQKIAVYVYTFIRYFSGFIIFKIALLSLLDYTRTSPFQTVRSVEAQEEVISRLCSYTHIAGAFVYSSTYFRMQQNLPALFNEALRIFRKVKSRTGPGLFLRWHMLNILLLKAVILISVMKYVLLFTALVTLEYEYFSVEYCIFPILKALMSFSYIFIQLTLLCFYEKMNEYLQRFGRVLEYTELNDCLRKFMSISRRVHSLQRRINRFSSSVFFSTYIGLFHDIQFVYLTLKIIFYSKYISGYSHGWGRYFPTCLFYIFDMFVMGLLCETLGKANSKFMAIVESLSARSPSLQRDVEMMLMRDNLRGIELQAFGNIKVNHSFSFDFAVNIILLVVISFLQFFAAEQVYSKHHRRKIVFIDYLHNV